MIFSNKETIKDLIIKELLIKNKNAEELQKDIKNKNNINISLFGLYKILRGLKKEEGSIIKVGKDYSISEEWKKKAVEALSSTNNNILLEDKEKLDFKFNSLVNLDHYWKNLVLAFHIENKSPIFFYAKHLFWTMLRTREKSEKEYIGSFNKEKRFAFYSISGNDKSDKMFKEEFSSEYIKINTAEGLILGNNQQLTIFDDYIITTVIPKNIQNTIDKHYKEEENIDILKSKIEKLHIENKNIRLIIERNKQKAKMFRKKLSKNFYIPKELIKKYDLY